ncbi:M50 family metallopeptidase [Actinophytocola sp.]|uniref:M50 family metallopeptidase n=1 Tax=Actinophytocola sp. TaxID=1872138 RepID=UPI003D6A1536
MSVMWTAAPVVMFVALVAVHEAAHALALRRHGIPISEAGLGLPFAPRLRFQPTPRRPFVLSVSIWLVGAYIIPDEAHAKQLAAFPYRDKSWFFGAGIVANAVIGTGLVAVLQAMQASPVSAAVWAAVTVVLWVGRRLFVAYMVPALAIPLVVFVGWSLMSSVGEPTGMVGVATSLDVSSALAAVKIVAIASLGLAILNMAPIYPLDGGKICGELVRRWTKGNGERVFQNIGFAVVVGLVFYSIISDVGWLIFS